MRLTQLACAGLVLKVFLALLPYLLSLMGRVQGLHSISSLDFSVVSKFYVFQVQLCSCPLTYQTMGCRNSQRPFPCQ